YLFWTVDFGTRWSPTLTLQPTSGTRLAAISATGAGFVPGETVTIQWDGTAHGSNCDPAGMMLSSTTASSSGSISTTFTVPNCAGAGVHTVLAVGAAMSTAAFTVTA